MSKKWHEWDFWDWNSIVKTIVFLGAFVFAIGFVIVGPKACMKAREKNLDAQTTAIVTKFTKLYSRSRSGNTSFQGLTIEYNYTSGIKSYNGVEMVPDDTEYRNFLYTVINTNYVVIHIKYSSKDPAKSLIDLDNPLQ